MKKVIDSLLHYPQTEDKDGRLGNNTFCYLTKSESDIRDVAIM